tara:strand:- start:26 stop:262 length:237 start_codon:yes stop_codon:yes gene_type:complete
MCLGSRPSPPPAPAPEPVDSPIEDSAETVIVGKQKKPKKSGKGLAGDSRVAMGRRSGTKSLQIPLAGGSRGGNLNYPT